MTTHAASPSPSFNWRTPPAEAGNIVQLHVPQLSGAAEGSGDQGIVRLTTDASDRSWEVEARRRSGDAWVLLAMGNDDPPSVARAFQLRTAWLTKGNRL